MLVMYHVVVGCNGVTTVPCDNDTPDDGWIKDGSMISGHLYCYKKTNTRLDWMESEMRCREAGGHLVSIHSKEENEFIRDYMLGIDRKEYWIGLTSMFGNGYRWVDGTDTDYFIWNHGGTI